MPAALSSTMHVLHLVPAVLALGLIPVGIAKHFRVGHQEDAHEFLRFFPLHEKPKSNGVQVLTGRYQYDRAGRITKVWWKLLLGS